MGRVTRFLQASIQPRVEPPKPKKTLAKERVDQDLRRVIQTWPFLAKHVRSAILTLIDASSSGRKR